MLLFPYIEGFVKQTGYGGTVQRLETFKGKIARHAQNGTAPTREIVVQLNAMEVYSYTEKGESQARRMTLHIALPKIAVQPQVLMSLPTMLLL